jgi:hypothetical protein
VFYNIMVIMIPKKVLEILRHEGVVAIVTQNKEAVHMVNTWNSYLIVTPDNRFLNPVGGMKTTEANLAVNEQIQMSLGSHEVDGLHHKGAGFHIKGTAKIIYDGNDLELVKARFPWARAVLSIQPEFFVQTA